MTPLKAVLFWITQKRMDMKSSHVIIWGKIELVIIIVAVLGWQTITGAQNVADKIVLHGEDVGYNAIVPLSGNRIAVFAVYKDGRASYNIWDFTALTMQSLSPLTAELSLVTLHGELVTIKGRENRTQGDTPFQQYWINPKTGQPFYEHEQIGGLAETSDFEQMKALSPNGTYALMNRNVYEQWLVTTATKEKTKLEIIENEGDIKTNLSIRDIRFSQDEKYAYVIADRHLIVYSLPEFERLRSIQAERPSVSAVFVNASASHAALIDFETIRVIELPSLRETARLEINGDWREGTQLLLSPDGTRLLMNRAKNLSGYRVSDMTKLWEISAKTEVILKCFMDDGRTVVYDHWNPSQLHLLDSETGQRIATLVDIDLEKWMILLADGHYYGIFAKGDVLVDEDGNTSPLEAHPEYIFSLEAVKSSLAEAFQQ